MKPLKLSLILILSLAFGIPSGCNRPVYLKPGQVVAVRKPIRVPVWVRNVETGHLEARYVDAQDGWWIGKPKVLVDGVEVE